MDRYASAPSARRHAAAMRRRSEFVYRVVVDDVAVADRAARDFADRRTVPRMVGVAVRLRGREIRRATGSGRVGQRKVAGIAHHCTGCVLRDLILTARRRCLGRARGGDESKKSTAEQREIGSFHARTYASAKERLPLIAADMSLQHSRSHLDAHDPYFHGHRNCTPAVGRMDHEKSSPERNAGNIAKATCKRKRSNNDTAP